MKKHLWIIRGIVFTIVFELLCFMTMYFEVKDHDNYFYSVAELLLIFIVFSALYEIIKGKEKRKLLFIIPISVIHLIAAPLRVQCLCYLNANRIEFIKNGYIYLTEISVLLILFAIVFYDVGFFLINLAKQIIIKKVSPKPYEFTWLIKSILFVIFSDLTLYASVFLCNSLGDILFLATMAPLLLLPAISFGFFKGDSKHPFLYNLVVLTTHIVLSVIRIPILVLLGIKYFIYRLPQHVDDEFGIGIYVVIFVAIWAVPLWFDTIYCLIKHYSQNEANAQV